MDTFRRVILPVLVVVVLLAAFVFRLSSCRSDASKTAPAGNSESPSVSATGAVASPSPGGTASISPIPPYSGIEIKSVYESLGLSVAEIRDAGHMTMVHYYKPTGVVGEIISRFDWFDRSTGARELVYGWAYTDTFEIKPNKSFAVLTTGLSSVDGSLSFPKIFKAGYADIDGAVKFSSSEEKYYAPIDKSYTIGTDRHARLTGINVNPGFVSFGFSPQPGYEGEFYTADASIPKMDINIADGYATMTLYKTLLAEGAEFLSVKENSYCSFASMTVDGDNLIIKLQLKNIVSRYTVSTEHSPATGLPYAVMELTNLDYDYPAGW